MAASDTVKNILCLGTEINEILETLIVRGQKSGEVRKEVVPVLTVYVLSTSIDSLLALAETKGKFICAQNGMTEEEFLDSIKDAQAVVLVNYSGLTVEQDTILRKELREAGVQYKVYKNTMMNRAFAGTACESLCPHLEGTNALAISATDATAPARILAKYAKQFPALELIAGVVEGNYNDQAGIQALSQVPSREELLGKLLGSIQSPITNFARVLNQIAEAQGGADTEAAAE